MATTDRRSTRSGTNSGQLKSARDANRGKPRLCFARNVSGGGLCLRWPQAPVKVDDVVKIAFVHSEDGVTSFAYAAGVVKWYSATEVGLAYIEHPVKRSDR